MGGIEVWGLVLVWGQDEGKVEGELVVAGWGEFSFVVFVCCRGVNVFILVNFNLRM